MIIVFLGVALHIDVLQITSSQLGNRDSEVAMLIEDTEMVNSYMDGKEYKAAKFALSLRLQLWKEHLGLLDFKDWSSLMDDPQEIHLDQEDTRQSSPVTMTEADIRSFEEKEPDRVLDDAGRTDKDDDMCRSSTDQRQDTAALDPLSDQCYYNVWRKTAETNTQIYRELFHCVPDDTVHTFEQHRQFLPDPTVVPHGHIADPDMSEKEICQRLSGIRGHLVNFPTEYLKNENLLGSYLRETVTPMVIFT
ncbi:uncharacterized protein BYT42DRAFT_54309 [Radiomyces spectabilis]|uniref:uncharacterized protein n=1 Tax=Radiomyces spectabilis TaxID=64574 RepID=UPI0022212920|nr:uncharacterized protein BYT42DRAFT_54309 [Radiomyces spectabilis]KAI8372985.1 hypothetical protein BYT42DRAFT_54309 [Radiomyces spectabilis]